MTAERRVVVPRRPVALGRGRWRAEADGRQVPPDVPAIVRRQLRQAMLTVAAVAAVLTGVPVIAMWVPSPEVWVVLSLAAQAAWVGLAVVQLRRAERLEK
ncbi:hypothetical protein E1295_45880 [Nonomuraea mesophila]|uniref:Uncharacterized protein n=1 Tax=Nonomuraea mesophila TaxID=2530382 RepID=A0A4R5E1D6_9ACTN|nr:hypothetical protein [Nonomuraea mesophila]TDE23781.1 hypothetical protein E1295_45880 [Nonomuraea mesophila]